MINLIPNEEKKKKVRDFYFRLSVVLLMTLGFSMIVASIAILPSYFLSSVKKNVVVSRLESQKDKVDPLFGQETFAAVSDIDSRLKLVEDNKQNKHILPEFVVREILSKKMQDIKITEIVYGNIAKDQSIKIDGIAPSRERLLLFRQALEDDAQFKEVDLPISNFIQGSNIKFSLSLIPVWGDESVKNVK